MTTTKLLLPVRPLVLLLAAGAFLLASGALAQPSQKPLLNRDGGGVKPNIMLTVDDSGSMMYQHMPENRIYVGAYSLDSPVVPLSGSSVRMDPSDNATLGGPGSAQGAASHFSGTIAAQRDTVNYRQRLMRSPDTNTIYYNPEVRYLPWALATYPLPDATSTKPAGRMANSPVTAAYLDPTDPTGGGTVNLTNVRDVDTTWCFRDSSDDCSKKSESYDPGLFYRLKKTSGAYMDPTVAGNYTQYSINLQSSFPKVAARTDCTGAVGATGCTQAQERQNFANWFTYYRTRNLLARGSLVEAFAGSSNTFRIGWGRINDDTSTSIDGVSTQVIQAGVRDFTSTTKTALFNWLYALPAEGNTPLPGAMRAVGEYYSRSDNRGPWSDSPGVANTTTDKTCRRSYHIMLTDGYWNETTTSVGNADNVNGSVITADGKTPYRYTPKRPYKDATSNTLADYAMAYWKKDLRPDLDNNVVDSAVNPAFWQHMVNFMVGLGVRGSLVPDKLPGGLLNPSTDLPALISGSKVWGSDKIDDLWHAALNSRGEFISAKDPTELASAIRDSVGKALEQDLPEAGVATASAVLQGDNRKYVPSYKTGDWSGDIKAYLLDADGLAGAQVWSAESKLSKLPAAWGSRNIVTWSTNTTPPSAVAFTWETMGADNQSALGTLTTSPSSTTTDMVNFLRGDRSNEGEGQPFRERKGVLGDFINSDPLLVKDSLKMAYTTLPETQGGTKYADFLTYKAGRTATLFVGGNDGMLHAFKDTLGEVAADDGKEVFAYVPKTVYSNLSKLANKTYGTTSLYHQFYVDGPLVEADAFVNAPGAADPSWRNYVLGSLGSGGRAVFGLDVTDTANLGASSVRWELSSATNGDLGYVSAPIQVGVLPNGEWVAIFGNGSFSTGGRAALFVVNLQTGVAQTLRVGTAGANGLGGVGVVRNGLGQITTLYAGDLKGSLWKFDYLATAGSRFQIAGGSAFFTATHTDGAAQPITQAPILFDHSLGGKIVVFGTGLLATESDANSTAMQATYGIWDKTGDSISRPMGRANTVPRSLTAVAGAAGLTFYSLSGTAVDWTSAIARGWVINLDVTAGMRVVYPPQVVTSKLALVSVVKPASGVVVCEFAKGTGLNLLIPVEQGANPSYPIFDTDGNDVINSSDAIVSGYGTQADGIDAVVSGSAVCSGGVCTTMITFQNSTGSVTGKIEDPDSSVGGGLVKDRVWRRIINPPIR